MSDFKFKSNRVDFMRRHNQFIDILLGHMTMDIDRGIKTTAGTPVDTGDMKAETRHYRKRSGMFVVESQKEYSATQEAGRRLTGPGAPTRQFTNYTTPGTSSGWFARAINAVIKNRDSYAKEAARSMGL